MSLLNFAIRNENTEVMQLLIERKEIDINAKIILH